MTSTASVPGDDHAVVRVDACPPWEDPGDRARYLCLTCGYYGPDQTHDEDAA